MANQTTKRSRAGLAVLAGLGVGGFIWWLTMGTAKADPKRGDMPPKPEPDPFDPVPGPQPEPEPEPEPKPKPKPKPSPCPRMSGGPLSETASSRAFYWYSQQTGPGYGDRVAELMSQLGYVYSPGGLNLFQRDYNDIAGRYTMPGVNWPLPSMPPRGSISEDGDYGPESRLALAWAAQAVEPNWSNWRQLAKAAREACGG